MCREGGVEPGSIRRGGIHCAIAACRYMQRGLPIGMIDWQHKSLLEILLTDNANALRTEQRPCRTAPFLRTCALKGHLDGRLGTIDFLSEPGIVVVIETGCLLENRESLFIHTQVGAAAARIYSRRQGDGVTLRKLLFLCKAWKRQAKKDDGGEERSIHVESNRSIFASKHATCL
jgi:hypothetical protein